MAGECSKSNEIEEFMTCSLGSHRLRNPKLLPCNHSFCTGCIKNFLRENNSVFTCPKCHLVLPLKDPGIDGLCEDFLFKTLQHFLENEKPPKCQFCADKSDKPIGTHKCLDCDDIACDECSKHHNFTSLTQRHTMVPIVDIKAGKYRATMKRKVVPCQVHSKDDSPVPYEFYCYECKQLACNVCAIVDHLPKGHNCKSIDETFDEKLATSEQKKLDLKRKLSEEIKWKLTLEEEMKNSPMDRETLENEVCQRAAHLIELIETTKQERLNDIKCYNRDKLRLLQGQLQEVKNQSTRIGTLLKYADAFLRCSSKPEYLKHENELQNQMMKTMCTKPRFFYKSSCIEIETFQVDSVNSVFPSAFGGVTVKSVKKDQDGKHVLVHDQMLETPKVTVDVDSNIGAMTGVVATDTHEIIGVSGTNIQIFSCQGLPRKKITCPVVKNLWNVAVRGKCLYVSERDIGKVYVIDFDGCVQKTIELSDGFNVTNHAAVGLAVDRDGTVYVCTERSNTIYRCDTNDNKAIPFISNKPDLVGPIYLALTPNGDLLVSNIGSKTIQAYNKQKELLWQYKGQGETPLSKPYGVCCDSECYIYLANSGNNTIEVLYNGILKKCICPKPGFSNPCAITIDENYRLICSYNYGCQFMKIVIWN